MGFFDLNIPYTESNKRNPTTEKSIRLKLAVKAMELGYTGVAYNRTITGVMSELDRCSISLFPISSILKVSPSISTSVNLHRRLLNVPTSTPFRQYTRLTVVVDTPAQGSALNSGNPVLKTYDIVAVRPLKQDSFDQACKNYEVDIIAFDFSENRFRLKQPLIKAAIERGVYFEITYSGLVLDAQLRRQMISNAKVLVDWTRGKNLIFSSAAPSVTELRGPYDVANLASLLGLSMERAKAAVSRTCRSLLENGLRKKKFYKEAIRVELITSDIEEAGFDDWLKWDPISSGEGDLQIDDMAKSFAASSKESKTVKAIDFVSIIDGLPSHGLHIKDMVSDTTKTEKPAAKFRDPSENSQTTVMETQDKDQNKQFGNCDILSANETVKALGSVEGGENSQISVMETQEKGQNEQFGSCDILSANETVEVLGNVEGGETCAMIIEEETKIPSEDVISDANVSDDSPSTLQCEEANRFSSDASLREEFLEGEHMTDTGDVAGTPVSLALPLSSISLNKDVPEGQLSVMGEDVSAAPSSTTLATLRSHEELQYNDADSVVRGHLADMPVEVQEEVKDHTQMNHMHAQEYSSEKVRRKQRSSRRSTSFPFKRLLKSSHFKKVRKHKTKSTILSLSDLIG